MIRVLLTVSLLSAGAVAQKTTAPDPFARVAFLIGRWEGTTEGKPGKGTVQREYARVLNGRFVRVRNRSEYPAQPSNPKGEIHEDEGFISFDRSRKALVFRQFHTEGFVNHYLEGGESTPTKIVFTTEAIENIPAGWRARETYVALGPDEFEEVFELSEAGKPFETYSRARFKRVK
jgi:hypothetical protein